MVAFFQFFDSFKWFLLLWSEESDLGFWWDFPEDIQSDQWNHENIPKLRFEKIKFQCIINVGEFF